MAKSVFRHTFSVFAITILPALPAGAAVRIWDDGAADSYWDSANNWDPNGYADSDDLIVTSGTPTANADISTSNGGSITLDGPNTVAQFGGAFVVYVGYSGRARMDILNAADLTCYQGVIGNTFYGNASVSGAGSTWTTINSLTVGNDGDGILAINNGGTVSSFFGMIGSNTGSTGSVAISGSGSLWDFSSFGGGVVVGENGIGTLSISDGGAVIADSTSIADRSGSTGNVMVSGGGSTLNSPLITVGEQGNGSMQIINGGIVLDNLGFIGDQASSESSVTVSGTGSAWNNSGNLQIGGEGTGILTINSNGSVTNDEGYIGYATGSEGEVAVSGAGSTWINGRDLEVGRDGSGTLTITGGGAASNRHCDIGYNAGAAGSVTVSGAGSAWSNSDRLSVGQGGSGTLTITGGGSVSSSYGRIADYGGSQGDVVVSGTGSTWTNTLGLNVGDSGSGTLAIIGGGTVTSGENVVIGWSAGASGEVTVSGAGSTWINDGYLRVGFGNTGTLEITDGGEVSNGDGTIGYGTGSVGEVTVRGAGSMWTNSGTLFVGNQGTGTLTVRDDGAVSVAGSLIIANTGSSTGTVHLEGGSLIADSIVANAGIAEVNWSGGTLAITGTNGLTLGSGGLLGNTVAIGPGKRLDVARATTVESGVTLAASGGEFFTGTLEVDAGGRAQFLGGTVGIGGSFTVHPGGAMEVAGQDLVLTSAPTLEGKLTLDQSMMSVPSLAVASGATLNLDSGTVSVAGGFANADLVRMGTSGAAIIRAGTFTNSGSLLGRGSIQGAVTNTGNIAFSGDSSITGDVANQAGGKIIISGGSAATFFEDVVNQALAEIRVSENCTATYFGDLTGMGSFSGTGTSYIEGDMRPGASPGLMTFDGDVVFGSLAGLHVELGGPLPGTGFDTLDIGGEATLGGTLDVSLINLNGGTFVPEAGDSFEIITADSGIVHTFYTELLPSLAGDLAWNVRYTETSVLLEVLAALLGADFDEDGDVDGKDFLAWQTGYGQFSGGGAAHADGDADADGDVDREDLFLWQDQFGSMAGSALSAGEVASSAVPEPVASLLLAIGGLWLQYWGRGRASMRQAKAVR